MAMGLVCGLEGFANLRNKTRILLRTHAFVIVFCRAENGVGGLSSLRTFLASYSTVRVDLTSPCKQETAGTIILQKTPHS